MRFFWLLAPLAIPAALLGQNIGLIPDTIAVPWQHQSHGWVSVGLGKGSQPPESISGIIDGWISIDHVAVGARMAGAAQIFGDTRSDRSLLVGARTSKSGNFVLAAAGVGHVGSFNGCECTPHGDLGERMGMVYSVEAHGTAFYAGLGLLLFGAVSTTDHTYTAFALTLDFGSFGRN